MVFTNCLLGLKSTVYLRKSARLKFEIDCCLTFGETFSYANMTAVGHVCEIILKLCGLKFCYKNSLVLEMIKSLLKQSSHFLQLSKQAKPLQGVLGIPK